MALFIRPQIPTLISSSHADVKSCTPNLSMTPPKTGILQNILLEKCLEKYDNGTANTTECCVPWSTASCTHSHCRYRITTMTNRTPLTTLPMRNRERHDFHRLVGHVRQMRSLTASTSCRCGSAAMQSHNITRLKQTSNLSYAWCHTGIRGSVPVAHCRFTASMDSGCPICWTPIRMVLRLYAYGFTLHGQWFFAYSPIRHYINIVRDISVIKECTSLLSLCHIFSKSIF